MPTPSPLLVPLLAALVALGPLSTDMYLSALPVLGRTFQAGVDEVQLTLSVFMVGFAVAQLVYGPLADRYGRKPPFLFGLVLFVLASLGCAHADSIGELIVLRFVQAIGGCAGPVLGRAIVRDLYSHERAARVLSYMGAAMALAPLIAPVLGGYLLLMFGWPSVFVALALYGLAGGTALGLLVPETRPASSVQQPAVPSSLLRRFAGLAGDRHYLGCMLCCAAVYSGIFAFISGSSFVIVDHYGYAPQHFGYFFAAVVAGYAGGSLIGGRLSLRLGILPLLTLGSALAAFAGIATAVAVALAPHAVAALIVPMALYMVGAGLVLPQSMAGALSHYGHMAGTASSLLGFVQMSTAATVGVLVGHTHDGTPLPMVLTLALMGLCTLGSCLGLVRPAARLVHPDRAPHNRPHPPGPDAR